MATLVDEPEDVRAARRLAYEEARRGEMQDRILWVVVFVALMAAFFGLI